MPKPKTALEKARSALKKAEGAHTPRSINAKLKNAGSPGKHKVAKTKAAARKR